MRHSSCKRLLALVLCAMLMLCNMSFSAFADTESGEPTETENPEVPAPAEEPVEEPAEEPLEEAEGEIPSEDEEPVLTIIPEEDELPILLNTYLYVGETAVNADNEDDVLGDGNVVFDSTTNTLTFKVNKPTITGLHDGALIDALDLETLTVEAPSGLTLKSSGSRGISVPKGDLTVNGNLNVSLNGGSGEACVYTGLGLTVNGNLSTDCYGVTDAYGVKAMNGPVTITGTAEVIVDEVGIYCGSGDVTIGGAAYFGVNSQATLGFCPASCIYTAAGGVNLKSFSLEIGVAAYGIFANGPVYIGSALNFSNTGGMAGGYGIRSTSGGIVIDGGANMKVGSGCECLNSGDAPEGIVINGSAVLENGFSEVSLAVITAAGGPITVKGDLKATGYGVYAVSAKGDITVEGGATVDAKTYNVSGRNTMAMISEQGSIKVSGNLKATGTGAGVYACQDITVGGDATVGTSVQTERDYIIKAETGELAVTGSLTTTGLAPVSAFGGAGITVGNNVTITNAAEDAIGMYSDGAITFVTGIWDVTAGKAETGEDGAETVTGGRQAILAKGGIEIAEGYGVTLPVGGKVVQLDEGYTVTEKDGATVAKHAIISQRNTVTVTFDLNYDGSESITVEVPVGGSIEEFPEVQRGEGADRWVLLGWYTEPARGINVGRVGTQITGETTFDEDTVVYAHWRLPGDVNGDETVSMADVVLLAQYVSAEGAGVEIVQGSADINGDESVSMADLVLLAQYVKAEGAGIVIH